MDIITLAVVTAATSTAIGSSIAAWYYVSRIGIEKQRSADMKRFYEAELAIEREKLEVERAKLEARRGNGEKPPCEGGRHARGPGDYTCPKCGEWSSS